MEHTGSFDAKPGISEVLNNQRIFWFGKKGSRLQKMTHLSADLIHSLVKLFVVAFERAHTTQGWGVPLKVQNLNSSYA